jgi:DNA primase
MELNEHDAHRYHGLMPGRIRRYLNGRSIPGPIIERFQLGWNGRRITIPVYDREARLVSFRLARDPDAPGPSPKMLSTPGARVELYGWERVLQKPPELIVCEGEFDRLVLEGQGFAAVSSTGGAAAFPPLWARYFEDIPYIYVCYDLDEAGRLGAARVARLLPQARLVRLPPALGLGGDVTDFFTGMKGTAEDFRRLLDRAQPLDERERSSAPAVRRILHITPSTDVALVKESAAIEWIVGQYVALRRSGRNFIGRCPFHDDRHPSLVVFPGTRSFHCFGCRAGGDCISFLMRREDLSFPEALRALKYLAGV